MASHRFAALTFIGAVNRRLSYCMRDAAARHLIVASLLKSQPLEKGPADL
jgi:hypothetical protein